MGIDLKDVKTEKDAQNLLDNIIDTLSDKDATEKEKIKVLDLIAKIYDLL